MMFEVQFFFFYSLSLFDLMLRDCVSVLCVRRHDRRKKKKINIFIEKFRCLFSSPARCFPRKKKTSLFFFLSLECLRTFLIKLYLFRVESNFVHIFRVEMRKAQKVCFLFLKKS